MNIKQQLDADLKKAMLAHNKWLATTIRGLKSVILYAEVAAGKRAEGLDEQTVIMLLQKESKKRQESADMFSQGGEKEKADLELAEKKVIEAYLPAQLSDNELAELVESAIHEVGAVSMQDMGKVIGIVKVKSEGQADGSRIANSVKQRLST